MYLQKYKSKTLCILYFKSNACSDFCSSVINQPTNCSFNVFTPRYFPHFPEIDLMVYFGSWRFWNISMGEVLPLLAWLHDPIWTNTKYFQFSVSSQVYTKNRMPFQSKYYRIQNNFICWTKIHKVVCVANAEGSFGVQCPPFPLKYVGCKLHDAPRLSVWSGLLWRYQSVLCRYQRLGFGLHSKMLTTTNTD